MPGNARFRGRGLLLAVLALAGVAALAVVALRPRAVPVDVAEVSAGPMRVTVDEEGKTRVRDVYTVSAPVSGKVLRSSLNPGDTVIKDKTIVAIIEETAPSLLDARARREIEAQIAAAKAAVSLSQSELNQTQVELAFARKELQRATELARTNVVAERSLQRAKADVDTREALVARAQANLEVRQRELETVRARLTGPESDGGVSSEGGGCCVSILAPVNGKVLRRIQESEKVVLAGTPLLEIGDVENLEVIVDLLSTDAVKVMAGATARIDGWGGGKVLPARVRLVEPTGVTKVSALGIEEQRVRVVLDIDAPLVERNSLGHDFRVFARISVWQSEKVLQVPLGALFRHRGSWAVFAVEDGRAKLQTIEIGQRTSDSAEALTGLKAGQRIIMHPSDRITDGARVTVRPSEGF